MPTKFYNFIRYMLKMRANPRIESSDFDFGAFSQFLKSRKKKFRKFSKTGPKFLDCLKQGSVFCWLISALQKLLFRLGLQLNCVLVWPYLKGLKKIQKNFQKFKIDFRVTQNLSYLAGCGIMLNLPAKLARTIFITKNVANFIFDYVLALTTAYNERSLKINRYKQALEKRCSEGQGSTFSSNFCRFRTRVLTQAIVQPRPQK